MLYAAPSSRCCMKTLNLCVDSASGGCLSYFQFEATIILQKHSFMLYADKNSFFRVHEEWNWLWPGLYKQRRRGKRRRRGRRWHLLSTYIPCGGVLVHDVTNPCSIPCCLFTCLLLFYLFVVVKYLSWFQLAFELVSLNKLIDHVIISY